MKNLNVAFIHDWLPTLGGAEKVLQELCETFPDNEIYTAYNFLEKKGENLFNTKNINVSNLNKLPAIKKYYQNLILLNQIYFESLNLSTHDIVISTSSCIAKGVIPDIYQKHICYIHSPARYAWDLRFEYEEGINGIAKSSKKMIARYLMHNFRLWDLNSNNNVDLFIANSKFVSERVRKYYNRESKVIYPPVDLKKFKPCSGDKEQYYITASRLVSYKKIDIIIDAFNRMPQKKLIVAGDGPQMNQLKKLANKNIEIVGRLSDSDLEKYIQKAKAFVFAAYEDFGIIPIEAQATGTPVICYSKGGTSETVIPLERKNSTGVWFDKQTACSIINAVKVFEKHENIFDKNLIIKNAERFKSERFKKEITDIINNII